MPHRCLIARRRALHGGSSVTATCCPPTTVAAGPLAIREGIEAGGNAIVTAVGEVAESLREHPVDHQDAGIDEGSVGADFVELDARVDEDSGGAGCVELEACIDEDSAGADFEEQCEWCGVHAVDLTRCMRCDAKVHRDAPCSGACGECLITLCKVVPPR